MDHTTREAYEAAIGPFLAEFNWVEHVIDTLIEEALRRRQLPALNAHFSNYMFGQKVEVLKLLAKDVRELRSAPFETLAQLNAARKIVAHGVVEPNLFGDGFDILVRKKPQKLDPDFLSKNLELARTVSNQLFQAAGGWFFPKYALDTDHADRHSAGIADD